MDRSMQIIAALSTPAGTAALAVIRASGAGTAELAREIFGLTLKPGRARHVDYRDLAGRTLDDVVVLYFQGPRSYTGEDTLEISTHGNPLIAQAVLEDLLARGCRAAEPGEFTRRAFTNGRLDLSQAEAVIDLIEARSQRALDAANQQLRGSLGRHLAKLTDALLLVLARIEAYIDFPDEDLPVEDRQIVRMSLAETLRGTKRLLATQHYGELLRDGIKTVIVGAPNAGKSSLLNALVGKDRALVSPEPGTTRDFIEERVILGPHCIRLIDTAGLRAAEGAIERLGISKTVERAAEADLFLWVVDAAIVANDGTPAWPAELGVPPAREKIVLVLNKADLLSAEQARVLEKRVGASDEHRLVAPSPASDQVPPPHPADPVHNSGEIAKAPAEFNSVTRASRSEVGAGVFSSGGNDTIESTTVLVSAMNGEGLDRLTEAVVARAESFNRNPGEETIAINARHADALRRAELALARAREQLDANGQIELISSDVREGLDALGEIAGRVDNERMLDHLFATFCIGK